MSEADPVWTSEETTDYAVEQCKANEVMESMIPACLIGHL